MPTNPRREAATIADTSEMMNMLVSQIKSIKDTQQELSSRPVTVPKWVSTGLEDLQTRMGASEGQLKSLQSTTVGTREYQKTIDELTSNLAAMAAITTQLPTAIDAQRNQVSGLVEGLVEPLTSMGTLLRAVLELVEGPLSLSDEAINRLTDLLVKRLNPQMNDLLATTVNSGFDSFASQLGDIVDRGVDRLVAEREALEAATNAAVAEMEARRAFENSTLERVWGLLGVVGVIMLGFAVAGGGVWAVMTSFGFPDGSRYIWSQFVNARGVWPRVGWGLCGVGFVGVVMGVVAVLGRVVSSWTVDMSGLKRWVGGAASRRRRK